ncbi:MAG: TIGR03032 family protein [Amaricoccus sp.]
MPESTGPGGTLWMSSLFQLWRLENFLQPGTTKDGFDAVYVPLSGHTTGDIDIHDVHPDAAGRPIFVATRFNCLVTLAEREGFAPLWRPPFIDRLVAEDRCHLNGFAAKDGRPAFASCVAATNVAGGWREHRRDGGRVIDIATGETVAHGLSMPHSPRLHQGRLWLVQSGTGEFGHVDVATGRFEPVCFLQGYARGLAFVGGHAVIGVSRPRENRTFAGLALNERLDREDMEPLCHLAVVNLATGNVEHRLVIEGVVQELYDVAILPRIIRPSAIGFQTEEIRFTIRPALEASPGAARQKLQ